MLNHLAVAVHLGSEASGPEKVGGGSSQNLSVFLPTLYTTTASRLLRSCDWYDRPSVFPT